MAALSATTAWNETAAFFKREAGLILPIALLLLAVPSAALQLFMPVSPGPGQMPEFGAWLILLPLVVIASIVGTLAISYLALRPGSSVGEGLQVGARRFLPLFLASFLIGFVALLVFILLAMIFLGGAAVSGDLSAASGPLALLILVGTIIGLFFWVRLMLMTPVAAVESSGPIAILRRSWALTRGHFWKLLGLLLLVSIVAMIIIVVLTSIIGIFVVMLAGPIAPGSTSFILMTILSALMSAVFSAVLITLLSRIYAQLSDASSTPASMPPSAP